MFERRHACREVVFEDLPRFLECDKIDILWEVSFSFKEATQNFVLIQLETVTDKKKSELAQTSKTSQLWLNYQRVVGMARMLIKADRTGYWLMHLQAVSNCLTVFAAAGHFSYL